jgi:acyl-CoA synthetase (AMP-forming)/AMP-acid ligase II
MLLLPESLRHSDRTALTDSASQNRWSWKALFEEVERRAAALRGDRKKLVFLFCRNDPQTVLSYLACVEAGHAVALLDAGLAPEFAERLIALYQPDLLLPEREGYKADPDTGEIHPDLALMLSTSGSTGTPKFVRLTRKNIESNARSIAEALKITPDQRPITSLPLHYSFGLSILNSHLIAGAEVVLSDDALTAPGFWSAFREHGCTTLSGVPYSYQILRRFDFDQLKIPSLTTMLQAGGKLRTELISHFHSVMQSRGGEFFVMYGQTEATARIAILPPACLPEKLGAAGKAIPGGTIEILSDDGPTTAPGITGEVLYTGPNVMMGYAQSRADLVLGDVLSGRLNTGDVGMLDEDGYLFLSGRRKRDAKVLGMRLNMDEVEELLKAHGPAAVLSAREKLIIFCEHGGAEEFSAYTKELSTKLKLHASVFEFRRVDALPVGSNGKIDYVRLEAQL